MALNQKDRMLFSCFCL